MASLRGLHFEYSSADSQLMQLMHKDDLQVRAEQWHRIGLLVESLLLNKLASVVTKKAKAVLFVYANLNPEQKSLICFSNM